MDTKTNFLQVELTTGISNTDTSFDVSVADSLKMVATGGYNMVIYNSTDYNPYEDPEVEIVRVTSVVGTTVNITRPVSGNSFNGEDTTNTAQNHNTAGKTYKAYVSWTKKDVDDITALLATKSDVGHTHVKADITDLNEADYATAVHTHVEADITDLDKYTQAEVNALLAAYTPTGSLSAVALSNDYNDLTNLPALSTLQTAVLAGGNLTLSDNLGNNVVADLSALLDDSYIDSASYAAGTGILTLGYSDAKADITVDLSALMQDAVTVTNSNSIDLTLAGQDITANVNVSANPGNDASIVGDGLYVPHETTTSATFDSATNTLTYNDEDGTANALALSNLPVCSVHNAQDFATMNQTTATLFNRWKSTDPLNINSDATLFTPSTAGITVSESGNYMAFLNVNPRSASNDINMQYWMSVNAAVYGITNFTGHLETYKGFRIAGYPMRLSAGSIVSFGTQRIGSAGTVGVFENFASLTLVKTD